MIIITDNKTYTRELLQRDLHWIDTPKIIPSSIQTLCEKIFPDTAIFSGMVSDINDWNYMFVTESAERSQYDILIELSRQNINLPDKLLCFAGSGNNFHGFKNRTWEAKAGNIHLTVYLTPNININNFSAALLALPAVSVIKTLNEIPNLTNRTGIKWVNDILIDNAKVSGVLAQTQSMGKKITGVILGIGLNVESSPDVIRDSFVPTTGALNDFLPEEKKLNLSKSFPILTKKLSTNYELLLQGKSERILSEYRKYSSIIGKTVQVFSDTEYSTLIAEGEVTDLNENLELIIEGYPKPINKGRIVYGTDK